MSIEGESFSTNYASGARIDFGVGSAGLANVFSSGYTIASLFKSTAANRGILGAYSAADASGVVREFLTDDNSGARLYSNGDFTGGFPTSGGGLNDGVWRWVVATKLTGSNHYRMHFADLATLTWAHGEASSAANHSDVGTAAVMFTTWAIYALGFGTAQMAMTAVWATAMSDADLEDSLTKFASDLLAVNAPKAIWSFKESDVGSPILDLTGGGADETERQSIVSAADPPDFDFSLGSTFPGGMFLPFFT